MGGWVGGWEARRRPLPLPGHMGGWEDNQEEEREERGKRREREEKKEEKVEGEEEKKRSRTYRVGELHYLGLAGSQVAGCLARAGVEGGGTGSAGTQPGLKRRKLYVHFPLSTPFLP